MPHQGLHVAQAGPHPHLSFCTVGQFFTKIDYFKWKQKTKMHRIK